MISEATLKQLIRDVPDFPTPGILFRDITPVLQNPQAFREVICSIVECARPMKPDVIVGIESRGFILGAPAAFELGTGFVPVRKAGKLPAETVKAEYALEYGTSAVEMHKDAIEPGMRAVLIDDLLATGGTARAAAQLVEEVGGIVAGIVFLIELTALNGRKQLEGYDVCTIVKY
ncbi:MAG: adenine phosphoribosyltransferase [Armatimonadota bacterium]|nr:adenine phosphoribosyltransferase [Armatimonadota bacterium]